MIPPPHSTPLIHTLFPSTTPCRSPTLHIHEETFRAALACLTDAIHAEPIAAWFGQGHRASADGHAFYLGGPGEAGGAVNAHYGRDPVVKIYTTITDRYAPLHQPVIAGTAGEAIHEIGRAQDDIQSLQ